MYTRTRLVQNLHVDVRPPDVQEDRVVVVSISVVTTRMIRHIPHLIDRCVRRQISSHVLRRSIAREAFLALVQFLELVFGQARRIERLRVQSSLAENGISHPPLQTALGEALMRLHLRGRLGQPVSKQVIGDLRRHNLRRMAPTESISAIRVIIVRSEPGHVNAVSNEHSIATYSSSEGSMMFSFLAIEPTSRKAHTLAFMYASRA